MAKVAFLGLGVMGFPMAGHLAAKGSRRHRLQPHRAPRPRRGSRSTAARRPPRPAEAARGAEIVFSCVGNDRDLREVTLGADGAFSRHGQGRDLRRPHHGLGRHRARARTRAARSRGIDFIDAPVSGGQAGAENGTLTVMCGGEAEAFERAKPVMAAYAKAVTLIGPAGAGPAHQDGEPDLHRRPRAGARPRRINFGQKAGLDMKLVLDVISKGAAQSWQMENRGKTMVDDKFDFGFAVDWMRKDLRICLEEAAKNGADLPVTDVVDRSTPTCRRWAAAAGTPRR